MTTDQAAARQIDTVPNVALGDPFAVAVEAGAQEVLRALHAARDGGGQRGWLGVVSACQSLVNTTTAVQDAAIVQVSRRESTWSEDGTLGEMLHAPGRVALDAADLVAPAIGATHHQAQHRVEQAVRLAGNRSPVPAETHELPDVSGLRELHTTMTDGALDGYRAGVIAHELQCAPADVAAAVLAALGDHLTEDATRLRRRTRSLLARISPDLVLERTRRARASTGLRRWVAEPGVDEWHGTFPSEDAATAWAAIDKLAHDLVANGTCSNLEQARGKALTDLVTGHANIDVRIVLTVPADTQPTNDTTTATPPGTAAPFPATAKPPAIHAAGSPHATATGAIPGSGSDLVQVHGARPSEPLLVPSGWLHDHLIGQPASSRHRLHGAEPTPAFVPCDPLTGARLDPDDDLATTAYRPGRELTALVKARDGRCRFPGCSVAARFCDLDHVTPWPTGPTTATNLLTLCRRHHRIKQRPGWRILLAPDGTATWTDPIGNTRTTEPLDALDVLVLTTGEADPSPPASSFPTGGVREPTARDHARSRAATAASPLATTTTWSGLETRLSILCEHHDARDRVHWARHRRCTSAAQFREAIARRRNNLPDLPPF